MAAAEDDFLHKTLEDVQYDYIECLSSVTTKKAYSSQFKQIFDQQFLIKSMTLTEFAKTQDNNKILDLIR